MKCSPVRVGSGKAFIDPEKLLSLFGISFGAADSH
jgi:hypothetical protein